MSSRKEIIEKFYVLANDALGVRYCALAPIWYEMACEMVGTCADDDSDQKSMDELRILQRMTVLLREHEFHEKTMGEMPERRDIDEMLIVRCLSPMGSSETARQAINRIINWEVSVNLDPSVSSDAQELINRGRREAEAERPWWRRAWDFVAGPSSMGAPR